VHKTNSCYIDVGSKSTFPTRKTSNVYEAKISLVKYKPTGIRRKQIGSLEDNILERFGRELGELVKVTDISSEIYPNNLHMLV
jgi:hypothetical protein